VNISSTGSIRPRPAIVPYAAAKAGLNALTEGLAQALGPHVRVNTLMAGPFYTDAHQDWDPESLAEGLRPHALQRAGKASEITGAALDPFAAYLLLRGLKTLQLRIERQNASALKVARYLEGHKAVAQVNYPGLQSHPQHEIAKRQMPGGFGGMLSFVLHGDYEAVKKFLPRVKFAHRAANLGAVETIVGPPATTSHVEVSAKDRAAMGTASAETRSAANIAARAPKTARPPSPIMLRPVSTI